MVAIRKVGSTDPKLRAIIAGGFGVGKTLLAASAAQHPLMSPVLFVNIEGGTATASNVEDVYETDQLLSVSDVEATFWDIANNRDGAGEYNTLVIDSGTALSQMALVEVARANAKASKSEIRMSQQDYLDSGTITLDLLRRFRNLNKHIIVTAGLREDFDIENPIQRMKRGPARVGPDLPPALARKLMHVYDAVWILDVDTDGTRQLLTQPQPPYVAKTRGKEFAEAAGAIVRNPNLADLFNLYVDTQGRSE